MTRMTGKSKNPLPSEGIDHKRIAREIAGFVQDAVGDMAHDMLRRLPDFCDDKLQQKIKKAKKNGVWDLTGWLADELYNDPDTLSGLIGDKICDAVSSDKKNYNENFRKVLDCLIETGHAALKRAAHEMRKEYK